MINDQEGANLSRKKFVSLMAGLPFALTSPSSSQLNVDSNASFPAKDEFEIKGTYLNAAYTHPMSKGSYKEVQTFLNERLMNGRLPANYDGFDRTVSLNSFAKLINASPEEIGWIPSTMFGENFVVNGLGIPNTNANVVTDAFHFHGSLHLYNELAKEGVDLVVVKPKNNQIDLEDLDKAIKPCTKLVSISLVSATTGFQQDLKKVCAIAHAKGDMVYADIIQAAGAVPIDVKDSNVDFCACATYKWLMGDFGIGFLYVRKDLIPLMKRTAIGYRQMASSQSHILPFETHSETAFESTALNNMSGHFEVGTFANEGIVALRYSLDYLNRIGVDTIQKYRQPMIDLMQAKIPDHRFITLTPQNSTSPIVCFAFKDANRILQPHLQKAGINISTYDNYIRISPSFYNDLNEIEQLIAVLKKAS
jgi:selenocysteine lyase/cysteine desulfurase